MLEWTGERFLPWIRESTIAYEHLHRYAYASALVEDKRVLDLACGEGYGSKMLSERAASVVGIDIDEIVVAHATQKYAGGNLQFLRGSITAVPLHGAHRFDVIVCFEAIEHIEDHETLLTEVKRLLSPGGIFIVSTPNKAVYGNESSEENPFHAKELYFDEFQGLLARYFENTRFLGQRTHPGSSIWPIAGSNADGFHEFAIERDGANFEFIETDRRVPLYYIAIASDAADVLPQPGSVLIDHSDSLIEEKNQQVAERDITIASLAEAVKWREGQVRELAGQISSLAEAVKWREGQARELSDQISSLAEALKWREGQLRELSEGLEWSRSQSNALEKTIASLNEGLAWRAHQVSDLETAAAYLERERAALAASLQGTQRQLSAAADTLAGIYASRGWRFLVKLRQIRNRLTRPATPRG